MTEQEARAELAKRVGHSLSEFVDDYAPLNERRYVMGAEHVLKKFGLVEAAPSDTDRESLVTFMHSRNRFDYDECQHGLYSGGANHGDPYKMCERQADALIASGFVRSQPVQVEVTDDMVEKAAIVSVPSTPEPCKCHQNGAYIAPTHSGHCCFLPAGQTCHPQEVADWEASFFARKLQAASTPEQEEER